MAKRKSITPKLRFEVFKRDSFKCQYCGKSAPEIILEIDHIEAVANGGTNDIMNLITSCFECNRGKSDKKLSDKTVIDKQIEQLQELQERRNQLDMLLQWKTGLAKNSEGDVEKVHEYFKELTGYTIKESALLKLKMWIKKYGVSNVIDSIEESYKTYYDPQRDNDNIEFIFKKIHSISYKKTLSPEDRAKGERVGVVLRKARNRFWRKFDYDEAVIAVKRFMSSYDNIERLEEITEESETYYDWKGELYA